MDARCNCMWIIELGDLFFGDKQLKSNCVAYFGHTDFFSLTLQLGGFFHTRLTV